ncbi:hypothetical protein PG994_008957 [Apiospora phragmitis]|uniref:Uncharacterized protein n=1 Tax=Apiospora phragmitis TaxID=2905665 RepID=A0ABR1UHY1_9PEZI
MDDAQPDPPPQHLHNLSRIITFGIISDLLRRRVVLLKERCKLVLDFVGIWVNRAKVEILDLLYYRVGFRR